MAGFVLPSRKEVGYLDPEIANEGSKVILQDGEVVSFNPPPPKPVMPDWSQIKSIRHYFNRTNLKQFPAWLYHPTEGARIVKDEFEAAELGVCYREATTDEKGRYGQTHVWDWKDDSKWRPKPYPENLKFNPNKMQQGKIYVPTPQEPRAANRELLETVLPEVTAAVVAALRSQGSVNPDKIDPKQWEEFIAFQAWKKTQEAIDDVVNNPGGDLPLQGNALSLSKDDEEYNQLVADATAKGIKVDKRWSLGRLKEEMQKAA